MRKPINIKQPMSACCDMPFPVNMRREDVSRYCDEVANKLADEVKRHIMQEIGPNWFLCDNGWRTGKDFIHEPGVYRIEVLFTVTNELLRF